MQKNKIIVQIPLDEFEEIQKELERLKKITSDGLVHVREYWMNNKGYNSVNIALGFHSENKVMHDLVNQNNELRLILRDKYDHNFYSKDKEECSASAN